MRAVVCDRLGDPSVLQIKDLPIPEPGPGDVLIKVGAASVNFPDVLMLSGGYQHKPELPFVPGMEGAGTIAAEAAAFRVGAVTAYHSLVHRAQIKQREVLLVHGASGGVGLAAVQLGKHLGARVIATGSDDARLAVVSE